MPLEVELRCQTQMVKWFNYDINYIAIKPILSFVFHFTTKTIMQVNGITSQLQGRTFLIALYFDFLWWESHFFDMFPLQPVCYPIDAVENKEDRGRYPKSPGINIVTNCLLMIRYFVVCRSCSHLRINFSSLRSLRVTDLPIFWT